MTDEMSVDGFISDRWVDWAVDRCRRGVKIDGSRYDDYVLMEYRMSDYLESLPANTVATPGVIIRIALGCQ